MLQPSTRQYDKVDHQKLSDRVQATVNAVPGLRFVAHTLMMWLLASPPAALVERQLRDGYPRYVARFIGTPAREGWDVLQPAIQAINSELSRSSKPTESEHYAHKAWLMRQKQDSYEPESVHMRRSD